MKKIILIIFLILAVFLLIGCTNDNKSEPNNSLLSNNNLLTNNSPQEKYNYLIYTGRGVSFEYFDEATFTEGSLQGIEETVAHLEYAPGVYANILKKDVDYELAAIDDCNWFRTRLEEKYAESPTFLDVNFIVYGKTTLAGKPACEFEMISKSTEGTSKLYQISANHQKSSYTLNFEVIQVDYVNDPYYKDDPKLAMTEEDSKIMNDIRYEVGMKFFKQTLETFKILENKINGFLEYKDEFLTMKYPSYMTTSVPQNNAIYVLFKTPLSNSDDIFQENMLITVFEKTDDQSLEDSANFIFDNLNKEDYEIISQENTTFLGYPAIENIYTYNHPQYTLKIFTITTLTKDYDISFEYTAEEHEFEKYLEDIKKSVASIEFII